MVMIVLALSRPELGLHNFEGKQNKTKHKDSASVRSRSTTQVHMMFVVGTADCSHWSTDKLVTS